MLLFLDLKGVVSVNDTFVPNMPFERLKCVASFVSGPETYPSNTRIQRFIVAADSIYEDKAEIFAYFLSSQPSSMFESSRLMRSAQKSTLADAIWNLGDCSAEYKESSYNYVVDGGSLMHKIPWQYWSTFGEICEYAL
jgi:hypothetical protein